MIESAKTRHSERRWPVVLSIIFVLTLLGLFPDRIRVFPAWVLYTIAAVQILSLIAVILVPQKPVLIKVERVVTLFFCMIASAATVVNLQNIIDEMLKHAEDQVLSGMQLLLSGLGVWMNNVLSFSILYWIVDRGGPSGRSNNKRTTRTPDWLFPQESAPSDDIPEHWRPVFIDYLYLGFCTCTAFSPTDAMPLTHRAKLLMMLQSLMSLLTILVVLSRAVNILGTK